MDEVSSEGYPSYNILLSMGSYDKDNVVDEAHKDLLALLLFYTFSILSK